MKRFKIGIAAVVALLAMSFTIVSKSTTNKKTLFPPNQTTCYASSLTTCSGNLGVNECLIDVTSTPDEFDITDTDCDPSNLGVVCCYETGTTSCTCTNPSASGIKISAIYRHVQ